MKPSDPLTFVVGVVPFSQAEPRSARDARNRTASPSTSTPPDEAAFAALLPLVQLLARTAAREAFGVLRASHDIQKD